MCNYLHKALLVPKDLADVHKSEMKFKVDGCLSIKLMKFI